MTEPEARRREPLARHRQPNSPFMSQTPPIDETTTGLGIRITDVRKTFAGGVTTLDGVSLDIPAGQFIAILGPSGCGKSTLLRIIANLERAEAGSVKVRGHQGRRSEIAYVFQDAHLLPWRNVLRNVALPLELLDVAKSERLDAARAAVEQVGLGEALKRYPAQLSGGMRMRVSLARALVTNPKLLLLDEPFAALDEITRQRLDEQLRGLWTSRGMTVIFVTHSIHEATFLAQRAVMLSKRPARIVLDRTFELPETRTLDTRTDPAFTREMRRLYDALEDAEV
ncbi:MAG: ABC transporter ATP-binding protein [Tepidisphaeraceae bacterium]